ncbi:MAG: hypothetical protein QOH53_116, partial [Ilumatobacteraceae bacterium]
MPKHSAQSIAESPGESDARPLDLHEWISFEDDTERRTWVFDAT